VTGRRVIEVAALAVGAAVFGYLAWDGALWDARLQAVLHAAAAAAIVGLAVYAWRGGELPRTRLDIPILALLLAFGIASLSAWNVGLSARAMAAILATTAMLPVALLALRHRPGWTAFTVTASVLVLAGIGLVMLGWRRLEWIQVGGPGLPPLRLGHEGTPFGSVAVPPFIILAALPLALLLPDRRLRMAAIGGMLVIGLPLTVLSGSRSAWIAIAVAALAFAGVAALRVLGRARLPRRLTPEGVAIGLVAGVALAGVAALIVPRLTEVSSLVYRGFLWRDTIAAWSSDPLLGIGPGAMPFARQAFAPPLTFPVRQPHSHNVLLGILGDAGLVGLAVALALGVAFLLVAGPWRQRTLPGRAAAAVLVGLGAGMLFEDLTFVPGFSLLVVLLLALALRDAGAVTWHAPRLRAPAGAAAAAAAAALLVVVVLGDAAAITYREAIAHISGARWGPGLASLQRAVALDPWHPSGPKSVAVAADRTGNPQLAADAARRAVELNPGDGQSWTNLAVVCMAAEDAACAREAADRAVEAAAAPGRELANAAVVYAWLGDREAADRTYRLSLLTNYWTALTLPWPRPVEVGDGRAAEIGAATADLNLLIGRSTLGEPIDPADYPSIYARLLAHAMVGDREAAEAEVRRAIAAAPGSATTWELAALVHRHYGRDVSYELAVSNVARGVALGGGGSGGGRATYDIATFRAYPADGLVRDAVRLVPDTPWPWVLERLLPPASG
jgi:O-antigen ligase/Tfp pilus assembly protein PilF